LRFVKVVKVVEGVTGDVPSHSIFDRFVEADVRVMLGDQFKNINSSNVERDLSDEIFCTQLRYSRSIAARCMRGMRISHFHSSSVVKYFTLRVIIQERRARCASADRT